VYKCGFAGTQAAYEDAYAKLFARLDQVTERLATRRYLVGDTITEADVRLWPTLVRFDAVYHGHFKCNRNKITEMPVLRAYARDLYQTPGFGDTIDFPQTKAHYYRVHTGLNPSGIIPAGPDLSGWLTPHHREELSGQPFGDGTPQCVNANPSVSGPAICIFTRGGHAPLAEARSRNANRPACAPSSNAATGGALARPSTVIDPSSATVTSGNARAHWATIPSSGVRTGS